MTTTDSTIYDDIRAERERAHAKHGPRSMERQSCFDRYGIRYRILLEEVGEVAKEFNDALIEGRDVDGERLQTELVQVAAMAAAWADAWRYYLTPDALCEYCGLDNRNGTHDALTRNYHLNHPFKRSETPIPELTEATTQTRCDLPADAHPVYTIDDDDLPDEREPSPELIQDISNAMRSSRLNGRIEAVLSIVKKVDRNARGWGIAHGRYLERERQES